jgi:hypothetical protein
MSIIALNGQLFSIHAIMGPSVKFFNETASAVELKITIKIHAMKKSSNFILNNARCLRRRQNDQTKFKRS